MFEIDGRDAMGDEDIINFILRSREKGRTDEQITRALISVGWHKSRVISAFGKIIAMKTDSYRNQQEAASDLKADLQAKQLPQKQAQTAPAEIMAPSEPVLPQPQAGNPAEAATEKKPLFSLPKLFGKKEQQPGAPAAGAQIQPEALQPQTINPPQQQLKSPIIPVRPPQIAAQPRAEEPTIVQQPLGAKQQQMGAISQATSQQPAQQATPAAQSQWAVPTQPESQMSPPSSGLSPISGMTKYFRVLTADRILFIAAVIALVAIAAGTVYFLVMPKGGSGAPDQHAIPKAPQFIPAGAQTNATPEPPQAQLLTNNSTAPKPVQVPGPSPELPLPPPAQPSRQTNTTPSPKVQPSQIPMLIVPEPPRLQNNSTEPKIIRLEQFTSTGPFPPDKFCTTTGNGTFYRAHYKGYYGGECVSGKPGTDGFANLSDVISVCSILPCCVSGPLNEYSTKYDWFECGYSQR